MHVYIVEAEHPITPGRLLEAYGTKRAALARCVELVGVLMPDRERVTAKNWRRLAARLWSDSEGVAYVECHALKLRAPPAEIVALPSLLRAAHAALLREDIADDALGDQLRAAIAKAEGMPL